MAIEILPFIVHNLDDTESLPQALDRQIQRQPDDSWVLVMDDDIMLRTLSNWYRHLQQTIEQHPQYDAFTTKINRGCGLNPNHYRISRGVNMNNHDMLYHINFAAQRKQRSKYSGVVRDITIDRSYCGVTTLIKVSAWKRCIDKFKSFMASGMTLHTDTYLHCMLAGAGLKFGMIEDYHVYHLYRGDRPSKSPSHFKEVNVFPAKHLNTDQSLKAIEDSLANNPRTFVVRFGDCEALMMTNVNRQGTPLDSTAKAISRGNQMQYNARLADELKNAYQIDEPGYLIAPPHGYPEEQWMSKGKGSPFKLPKIVRLELMMMNEGRTLLSFPVFGRLAVFDPERFQQFVRKHILGKRLLFIGSTPKKDVEKLIGRVQHYIKTPDHQSYNRRNDIVKKVQAKLESGDVDIVLPASGYMTKVLAEQIWKAGYPVNLFDLGSIFDIFKKPATRNYLAELQDRLIKWYNEHPIDTQA